MSNMTVQARNALPRNAPTTLVVVKVNAHGKPDTVSCWECPEARNPLHAKEPYLRGALIDICV